MTKEEKKEFWGWIAVGIIVLAAIILPAGSIDNLRF